MKSLHCLALFLSCIALFSLTQSAEVADVTPIGSSYTGTVPEPELIGYYVYRTRADPSTIQLRITLRGIDIGNVVDLQVQGCNLPSVTGNQPVSNNTDVRKCSDYGNGCTVVLPRPCYLIDSHLVYISVSSPNGVNFDLTIEEEAIDVIVLENGYNLSNETLAAGETHRYVLTTSGDFLQIELEALQHALQVSLSPFPNAVSSCGSPISESVGSSFSQVICPSQYNYTTTWYLVITEIEGTDNTYNLTTFVGELAYTDLESEEPSNGTVSVGGIELFKIPLALADSTFPLRVELEFESDFDTHLYLSASTNEFPLCDEAAGIECERGAPCQIDIAGCGTHEFSGNFFIAVANRHSLDFHEVLTHVDFKITATLVPDTFDQIFEVSGAVPITTGTTDFEINVNETFLAIYDTAELTEESHFVLYSQFTGPPAPEEVTFQVAFGIPGCGNVENQTLSATGEELQSLYYVRPFACFNALYEKDVHIRVSTGSETAFVGNVTVGFVDPTVLTPNSDVVDGSVSDFKEEGPDSGIEIYSFSLPKFGYAQLNVSNIVGVAGTDFADYLTFTSGCTTITPDDTDCSAGDLCIYTFEDATQDNLQCAGGAYPIVLQVIGSGPQVNYSLAYTSDYSTNITTLTSGQTEAGTIESGEDLFVAEIPGTQSVIARLSINNTKASLIVEPPNCQSWSEVCESGECVYTYIIPAPRIPQGDWTFRVSSNEYTEYSLTVTWGTDNCEQVSLTEDEDWCAKSQIAKTLEVLSEKFTTVADADNLAQLQYKAIGVLNATQDCLYALQDYVCFTAFPTCDANGFISSEVALCNQCSYFFDACRDTGVCFEYAACEAICEAAGVDPQPPNSSATDGTDGSGSDGADGADGADGNSSSAGRLTSFLSL